jgi:glycosyltransferase involved in cell wall biosynthesis
MNLFCCLSRIKISTLKICFICPEYPDGPHGGIGTMVQLLSRGLVDRGHAVKVIGIYPHSYPSPEFEEDQGVSIWRIKCPQGKFGWVLPYIKQYRIITRWAKKKEIDIVEAPDSRGWYAFWPKRSVPLILRTHGSNLYISKILGKKPNMLTSIMERLSYRRADHVVSVSKFSANLIAKLFSIHEEIPVIYNGIEIPVFRTSVQRKNNTIVFSGSLCRNKGIFNLINAFCLVADKEKSVMLDVYGKDTFDKEVGSVQNYLLKTIPTAILSRINFHGHISRSDLLEVYRSATFAIFPSFVESFSMAPLESMICGCPTIYTKFSSGPEVIADGVDGILIDPFNVNEIAEMMIRLLKDSNLRKTLSENGINKIKTNFSTESMIENSIEFYRAIANKPFA